ncbi:GMC family oxidoreductase [Streptomyces sp. INA 01156]
MFRLCVSIGSGEIQRSSKPSTCKRPSTRCFACSGRARQHCVRDASGGGASHEVGGARMGNSPQNSVIDSYNRCWDVRNLFVLDGAAFVSSPDKNPTLTILALAARSSAGSSNC